jgi:putative ABC transport system permease protein
MIKNYLTTAFRALRKNKTFTVINILGLVIGISFSCMLYMYVKNELSHDRFHEKSDRIYRVLTVDKRRPQDERTYGVTSSPVGSALVNNYPEVTDMVRLFRFTGQVLFEINGENFQERNWFTADANFFDVFDFEFIHGDKATALKEPFSLVMTETAARKYFGNDNPVGKLIEKTLFGPVQVTGMIKDHPDNSHLKFDLLFSAVRTDDAWRNHLNDWQSFDAFTYIVLEEGQSIESVKAKVPALQQQYLRDAAGIEIDFQALHDIHLHSHTIEATVEETHGQLSYIYIFATMGLLLLVIACINYINLATAKALVRAKEVGIRKSIGAYKTQLVTQFLTESFLITLLAMMIAIGAMDLFFPFFNRITGKEFSISLDSIETYVPPLLIISLVIGLISGGYPSFYLATLQPVASLKGNNVSSKASAQLRKGLVVFQFVLTIVMIVSTLVIGSQLNFIQTKNMGFDKDQLLVIDINSGIVRRQFETMKHEFAAIPGVLHVGVSSRVPGEWKNIAEIYVTSSDNYESGTDSVKTYFMGFDDGMLETYKFTLLSGKNFSGNGTADSTQVLINESAVAALGLSDPVGSTLKIKRRGGDMRVTVIGVLQDFNFQSLHQRIAPIIIGTWNNPFQNIDYFTLKFTGAPEKIIDGATQVHNRFDQRSPIEYHFLDKQLQAFYVAETRAAMIFKMGAGLSVFVACLGLYGLASYNIERRTKELGIRKVLGASGANLFLMLSKSFTQQVGIAFLIATPLAYYVMNEWLSAFEYKIPLHAGIFLLAGLIALLIALATVSYRAFDAARSNPVQSLRQQ